jgi:hypothetical protein
MKKRSVPDLKMLASLFFFDLVLELWILFWQSS